MTLPAEWPDRLPGYEWRPAHWALKRKERGLSTPPLLPAPPPGILIHSGSTGEGTAEWAWSRSARYWAQFAWSSTLRRYVQTDWLTAWAPHGGALNRWSIGIETPHHPGQGGDHREATIRLVRELTGALGSEWITGHRFGDHDKRDPSEIVTADWWAGLGLRTYWTWQGEGFGALIEAEGLG